MEPPKNILSLKNKVITSSWLHRASMMSNALLSNECTQMYKTVKLLKKNN